MTNDYKKTLIEYVTGNLETTSPTTDEIFKEIVEANRNDWIGYMPSNWTNMHIEGIIKSNTGDVNILYGGYYKDDILNSKGFIIIVDNNFKPIKYIDKFSSGTDLRYIQCMKQDETGAFYFVDDTVFPYDNTIGPGYLTNGQRRFVLVNNFTVSINNEYKVNLRTSYNFSKSYSGTAIDTQMNSIYVENMEKDPNSSNYVFIGKRYNTRTGKVGFNLIHIVQLTINVGQANEWKHWTFTDERCYYGGSFISFNSSGSPFFRVIGSYDQARGIYQLTKDYGTDNTTNSIIYTNSTYPDDAIPSQFYENQCVFLTQNEAYFVVSNQLASYSGQIENKHIALYKYNFSNSALTQIYDRYLGKNPSTSVYHINKDSIYLSKNQGYLYIQYCKDYLYENNEYTANYYIQRFEGTWNPKLLKENGKCILRQRGFYVENNYNLLKIFCLPLNLRYPTWYFPVIKEVYNPNQYNGEPYVSVDSFCPLVSNLYSNGSLVFSRNLYNISKQNNMTMSSVEIPNTYLNDTNITQNDLISETNLELVNDTTNWNKNIYEVVDVNFLNTIRVIDEDTNTPYLESAIKLNNATTDGGDANYTNTPCNKARINYTDNTTKIISVNWSSIDDTHKETLITFYVDKKINNIDLISNDETTIYLTIPVEVEVNKYYSISQKIRIE